MAFDKRTLVLPEGAVFEERTLATVGDLILGDHVRCGYGLRTPGRVFLGRGVEVKGDIAAGSDLRADTSTHIEGSAKVGAAGFLGERCFVQGDLEVETDLDVGDDVRVGGRLQAKGWVNKRDPVPMVLYIFLYMLELMRLGHSEEVERILKELEESDADIAVSDGFLFVPDHSVLDATVLDIHGNLDAAKGVRILGNATVRGHARLGEGVRVFGAVRADGDVELRPGAEVQGDLVSGGEVVVGEGCTILGNLHGRTVILYPGATIDGKVVASEGVSFRTEAQAKAQQTAAENVETFAVTKSADLADLLG
ncbi:MAG: hypothetical protein WC876_00950 [Candidatus Thermoplasmatota archaeon]